MTMCEECINYVYDDEDECYYCDVDIDEDEMVKFLMQSDYNCPYYRSDDDYLIVRKQN